jgi:hypothetical protein
LAPTSFGYFCWRARALASEDGGVSERDPEPVVSLMLVLDEVFTGFAGHSVAVVRRELEDACEVWDCPLDEDTLDVFAREIAAGERVEIDAGTIGVSPTGPYPF